MRSAQVSCYVFRESPYNTGAPEYLALRRTTERGGFWQSVTGGVESGDFNLLTAAVREATEETGLETTEIFSADYSFPFTDPEHGTIREHVFGAKVAPDSEPTLSDEHDAALWVPYGGLRQLLPRQWSKNLVGLDAVHARVSARYPHEPSKAFTPDRWSLMVIKPDAFELGIEEEVLDELQTRGLRIARSLHQLQLTPTVVDELWLWGPPEQRDDWYRATVDYMTRRPVDVHLMEGPHATTHLQAVKYNLRVKYDKNLRDDTSAPAARRVESITHCSDRMEELARNAITFFPGEVNNIVHTTYANQ